MVSLDDVAEKSQEQEEENQIRHGINAPLINFLPTVAELTECVKILPC
jgi:hypothetical protein